MKRFENKMFRLVFGVLRPQGHEDRVSRQINEKIRSLGEEGWQLVQVLKEEGGIWIFVTREKPATCTDYEPEDHYTPNR